MNHKVFLNFLFLTMILCSSCSVMNDGIKITDGYILDKKWDKNKNYKNWISVSRIIPEEPIASPENFNSKDLLKWKIDYTFSYCTSYKRRWEKLHFNEINEDIDWNPIIDNENENFRESNLEISTDKIGKLNPFSFYEITGLRHEYRFLIYVSENGSCRVVKQKYGGPKGAW